MSACPRCGAEVRDGTSSCISCGFYWSNDSSSPENQSAKSPKVNFRPSPVFETSHRETASHPIKPAGNPAHSVGGSFWGWETVRGTVIHVDQPFSSKKEINLPRLLINLVILGLFALLLGPMIIGLVLGVFIAARILSFTFPSIRGGKSCIPGIFSHMASFVFTHHLFRAKEMVLIRDVRIRESSGRERLVRIKGDIVEGNFNVGDEVWVEGVNRGGTIFFRKGVNKRINSKISVKV